MSFSRTYWVAFTASGANLTSTAHGLYPGDQVQLATTTTLPGGLFKDTTYYVVREGLTADVFQLSTDENGDPITTTSAGTGTHTFLQIHRARMRANVEDCK